jgi:nucleoside 2-deoxyribosyltransferase
MRLYFAGPLFCDAERAFNARLAERIEEIGYEVFLPQRDGLESDRSLESLGAEAWARAIFELDRDAVLSCNVLLCILDGRVPDEGMALELGLAYAERHVRGTRRRILGYTTDFRVFSAAGLNAMLTGALDEIVRDEESLLERLRQLLATEEDGE